MSIETLTNGYKPEILDILSLISIIFGILVIINKNPVISVLFLIGLFFTISCYLITLGISFIGLAYLLVYVGAVSILFLFIVMLINVRISELFTNTNNSIFLAIIIIITFNYAVINILPHNITRFNNLIVDNIMNNIFILFDSFAYFNLSKLKILFVTGNVWDSNLAENTHISSLGNVLYTNYSIWLILASIILLLAMIGSIVITIKPKKL